MRWRETSSDWSEVTSDVHGVFLANLATLGAGLRLPVPGRSDDGQIEVVRLPRNPRVRLLRSLLGLVGAIARVQRVRIGFIGLAHGVADTFGRASVNVGDHLGVLRGEFVELIHAAANRIQLPIDIFLAGKRIQMSPEALFARIGQRIFAGCGLIVALGLGLLRLRLILCGLLILLCNRGNCHGGHKR